MDYNKYINTMDDINKLKEDLMENQSGKTASTIDSNENRDDLEKIRAIIAEEVRRIINTQTGLVFEDNIRGLLKIAFNFKDYPIPRKINYRKIEIEEEIQFALDFMESKISINGKEYIFKLESNFSISFFESKKNNLNRPVESLYGSVDDKKNTLIEYVENEQNIITKKINGKNVTFFNKIEIECDGIFELDKTFSLDKFSSKEFSPIFSTVEDDEKGFEFAIIETKLDKNKISDIINQIEKDSLFFEPLLKKKCIFIGFINCPSAKTYNYTKKLKTIKCKIFGIKSPIIYGKNMTRHIDWDLEEKFQKLDKKIDKIEKEMAKITNILKEIKSKKAIKISDTKSLGKKHHRAKTPLKKNEENE